MNRSDGTSATCIAVAVGLLSASMFIDRPRVIINDRALYRVRAGVGHYIAELVNALQAQDPGIELIPVYQTYFSRRRRSYVQPPIGSPAGNIYRRWPWWFRRIAQDVYNIALENIGLLRGCNLYHEPNHIPAPWPGPVVTTIHDLSVLRYPQWHPPDRVRWYERDFYDALPRSDHFITVSKFSKQEMVELLGINPQRITAIALGARAVFHPRPKELVSSWLASHHLPDQYLAYVGTLEPRKNIVGVLTGYARLPIGYRQRFPLLIAGMVGWGLEDLDVLIRKFAITDHVRFLGYLTEEALSYLYAGARVLVWPTFYEGFGLPPLECMACGTPVIASRTSSLPEVVGDAGILVDPNDVQQITDAIHRVLEDEVLAQSLSEKGLRRSQAFSWSRCAAEHAAIYRQFAAG